MSNGYANLRQMFKEMSMDDTVKSVVEIILESDWNEEVKSKLSALELSLPNNSVLSILRELGEFPFKALEFFQ
ncbi:hypothetical protein GIB67_030902 [Kingdonia uniflora]|uniref:Uncharacterized protein n=1 Tax=Kingdonia uniflora TaxID=39325 RepID=A0A7J7L3K0_9MAGN|nr:hypothetical protein GIB67_030902 [Kingdonia uniflora]